MTNNPRQDSEPPIHGTLTGAEYAHSPTPLALQAQTLANEVVLLRETANALATRATRHGWVLFLTIIALVIDVGLSILAFVLLNNQATNTDQLGSQQQQIERLVARLDAQQKQSRN